VNFNSEKINEILDKIPISLFLLAYLGYLGMDYYNFQNDPTSDLIRKQNEITVAKQSNQKLASKLKEFKEFVKTLEVKKAEIRKLAQELHEAKATLSENLDIPAFMKMTITEARKVGLRVISLKPTDSSTKEYYTEQLFLFTFRGVYVQVLAFLERLANVSQIVRVEEFSMRPVGSSQAKYVELEGTIELKTYKYIGSKADSLGSGDQGNAQGQGSGEANKASKQGGGS
jgi:Tfp pilus assembly protein PilO